MLRAVFSWLRYQFKAATQEIDPIEYRQKKPKTKAQSLADLVKTTREEIDSYNQLRTDIEVRRKRLQLLTSKLQPLQKEEVQELDDLLSVTNEELEPPSMELQVVAKKLELVIEELDPSMKELPKLSEMLDAIPGGVSIDSVAIPVKILQPNISSVQDHIDEFKQAVGRPSLSSQNDEQSQPYWFLWLKRRPKRPKLNK